MQARAILAVFEDFIGEFGFVFYCAETVFEKEVWDAGEKTDGLDAVLFCFIDERLEDAAAGALAFGFRLDDDGAHFAEMRSVKVERAATEKDSAIGFFD